MNLLETKTSVRVSANSLVTKSAIEEILLSAEGIQLQESGDNGLPELLFYEIGRDAEKDFKLIESMLETG